MQNEDGLNSGARNVGRFFLMAIPYVLGLAAMTWLGVYIGIHDFNHQLTQEERAAVYTGAKDRPTSKIAIEMKVKDCTKVTRGDIDGTTLVLYAINECHSGVGYMEWHWQEVSPNGTVIHENYTNSCPIPRSNGEIAECTFSSSILAGPELPDDDRTSKVRVWTQQ